MKSDGQSKNPGLNLRVKNFSAMATVASSSGRASVCGSPKRKPSRRRMTASERTATRPETSDRRSSGGGGMIDQRLERSGHLHVVLIAALIQIKLFSLDGVNPRARGRRSIRGRQFVLGHGRAVLVIGVVRPLPRQPVGRPF